MLEGQTIQQIGFPPMPAVAAILSRYDRNQLAMFITVAIDLMDLADGDPDVEVEDRGGETMPVPADFADPLPDDDVGDPDLEETDAEDSFVLSTNALRLGRGPGCEVSDAGGAACGEDDEDDDPAGQCDEDGINIPLNVSHFGPGCIISDDDIEHDGREEVYD